jgi:hypothetical protein
MKRAMKLSLISVHDYPRNCYRAYFAYRADKIANDDWVWIAWIFDNEATPNATGQILAAEEKQGGGCKSENEARAAAQTWIAGAMPKYRRDIPITPIDDYLAQEMVDLFDEYRGIATNPSKSLPIDNQNRQIQRDQLFGMLDRMRGELKAQGITLAEGESIAYAGATTWTRG